MWSTINDGLITAKKAFDVVAHTIDAENEVFTPFLNVHPPFARQVHKQAIDKVYRDMSHSWETTLLLEAGIAKFKQKLERRRVQWMSSAHTPVFALPDEILREIFLFLWQDDSTVGIQSVARVRIVCRRWLNVAAGYPIMSSRLRLPNAQSLDPVVTPLVASSSHPLHLIVQPPAKSAFPESPASDLGKRLASLSWNTSEDLRKFFDSIADDRNIRNLENLKTLSIKGSDRCTFCPTVGKEAWAKLKLNKLAQLPKLRSLTLERVQSGGVLQSSSLTSLVIRHCAIKGSDIDDAIRGSPQLELLVISNNASSRKLGSFMNGRSKTIFTHPSLQTIIMSDLGGDAVWGPLYYGRYPNLRSLTIGRMNYLPSDYRNKDWLAPEQGIFYPLERALYQTVRHYSF